MAVLGLTSYGFGGDSEPRTAGLFPTGNRHPVEIKKESMKGPTFSDHLNSAAYQPGDAFENRQANTAKIAGTPSGKNDFSFWDIIDIINPLQHIPVVSTLYRHLTGDEIRNSSRLVGDAIYGGALGAAASLVDIAFKNATGKDAGETVMALLTDGGKNGPEQDTLMAQNNLSRIAPAAGPGISVNDIIWNAPVAAASGITRFLPPGTPTKPESTPVAENPQTAAQTMNDDGQNADRGTASESPEPTASRTYDSPSFPIKQEAPAAAAEHGLPPALIAQKMMQALDAYGAMKRKGL